MDKLIDYGHYIRLRLEVERLSDIAGIRNQISHLNLPDDNENHDSVFQYLEIEIGDMIEGWSNLLVEIQKIKKDSK